LVSFSYTTVNSLRPLSRLALRIALPPRVCILAKKPCFLFRGILFGWLLLFLAKAYTPLEKLEKQKLAQ